MRPKIGITLDWAETGSFSKRPHYALRQAYFDAIYHAGGLPVGIPFLEEAFEAYLNMVDGVIIPGSSHAAPDSWYVESDDDHAYKPSARTNFDAVAMAKILKTKKPFLGICGGMQVMGCVTGGKMHKNVHSAHDTAIDHLNGNPAEEVAHTIHVTEGTLLAEIIGKGEHHINSAHVEVLVELGDGVITNAIAEDGAIEGIELKNHPFALGVQWHPEFLIGAEDGPDFKILSRFVEASRG